MSDPNFNSFTSGNNGQKPVTPVSASATPTNQVPVQNQTQVASGVPLSPPKPVQSGGATGATQNTNPNPTPAATLGMSLPQQKPTSPVIQEPKTEKKEEVSNRKRVLPQPIIELLEAAPDARIELSPEGYRWIMFDGEHGVCEMQESSDNFDVLEAQTFTRRTTKLRNLKDMFDFYLSYRNAARKSKVEVSKAPPLLNKAVIESMEIVV